MLNSPFGGAFKPVVNIPEDCEVVFVADMFKEDYVGGAELTTEALIEASPFKVFKIHSKDVTLTNLEQGHEKYWVFGNFANLNKDMIPTIVANMNYSILEYDYKFCKYRSPEKHELAEKIPCNCPEEVHGKIISSFMYGAKSLWWMSEKQEKLYTQHFPFLKERENWVLSSVFDEAFFIALKMLRTKYENTERKGWVVLGSPSWIKGAAAAEKWCKDNNKEYEVVWGISYDQVLEKLAQAEGFVYLPEGGDTCPRMVIEAKLLGCKLHLNENVQHKDELWFNTDEMLDTESYLYGAKTKFWNSIKATMNYNPSLSGYTTTLNCIKHDYPWRACINSLLAFCDEVIVVDGGSEDGTWEELLDWAEKEPKLNASMVLRDWNHPRFAVFDGAQKATARSMCSGEYCWQQDADEVVHENDFDKIKQLVRNFPKEADLISLPVIEYWGGPEKVRMDINPWKWRLSRNKDHITHGIPKHLRQADEEGNLHSLPGTDGCDYIHAETHEIIYHLSFYNQEIHNLKMSALSGNEVSKDKYEEWFNRATEVLPGVHHFSWYNLPRKIKTYRDYWSQHWQSLYNIPQEDTADNNMFFDKSWSDVTDEEINELSQRLASELGGWVFHSKVNWDAKVPHVNLNRSLPKFMDS